MFQQACPSCGVVLRIDEAVLGNCTVCPSCKTPFWAVKPAEPQAVEITKVPIRFACPTCKATLSVPTSASGTKIYCKCGQKLQVPIRAAPAPKPVPKTILGVEIKEGDEEPILLDDTTSQVAPGHADPFAGLDRDEDEELRQRRRRSKSVDACLRSVVIRCRGCDASLTISRDLAGCKVECPECDEVVRVPGMPRYYDSDSVTARDGNSEASTYGGVSLCIGIVSVFFCGPLLGPLAIIFGIIALTKRKSGTDVCGVMGIILGMLGILAALFIFLVLNEQEMRRHRLF